ncbi:MAG: hypothetical protein U9O59_08745 [Actinomycetota bacterium]|nr:hypothetical protein [Actinomycetota bacterium]
MDKNKKVNNPENSIKIRDLVSIFIKRKWYFTVFFAAVLVVGLLFTFIKAPQYESYSYLELKGAYYDENIYKYFPEEAEALGIFAPEMDVKELEGSLLKNITVGIRDEDLLEEVSGNLDFKVSSEELEQAVSTLTDSGNKVVRVTATYDDADKAYRINDTLISLYLENSSEMKSEILDNVILEIDSKIEELQGKIREGSGEDGLSDDTGTETDAAGSIIEDLEKIKYNLENNRETYINNIEIQKEPFIPSEAVNMNIFKSLMVAIFASAAAGLIAVYLPGVFSSFRER